MIIRYAKAHTGVKAAKKFKVHPITITNWRHGKNFKPRGSAKQTYKKLNSLLRKMVEVVERLRPSKRRNNGAR